MANEEWFGQEDWAKAWDKRSPLIKHLVPPLMEALAPAPDERILDVGTGMGPIAIAAAEAVGSSGRVVAVDLSEPVLRLAEEHARQAGANNIDFHALDAGTQEIPGGPFDALTSLLGFMFFPDPVGAFTNLRHHMRQGGRAAMACWGHPDDNPLLPEVLLSRFAPDAGWTDTDGVYGPFSLAMPGRALAYLGTAEWKDVHVEPAFLKPVVAPESVFDEALLGLYGVDRRRRDEALEHVNAEIERFRVADGIEVPMSVNIVHAVVRD